MKIAIDIDEVLADFLNSFLEFYNTRHKSVFKRNDFFTYDWWEVMKIEVNEIVNEIFLFNSQGWVEKVPTVSKSEEAIKELAKNHELMLVTGRPKELERSTAIWLERNFPPVFKDVYFTDMHGIRKNGKSKGEFCKRLGMDLLIDDNYYFGLECRDLNTKVFLFESPWNRNKELVPRMERYRDWPAIMAGINKIGNE